MLAAVCAGQWKYLYRTVDGEGHTIDFLLRAKRDGVAARRFLERVIDLHGTPEKIAIDKSGANTAAIEDVRVARGADIEMRQLKYVNNIVEQDHQLPCGGPSHGASDRADRLACLVAAHHLFISGQSTLSARVAMALSGFERHLT